MTDSTSDTGRREKWWSPSNGFVVVDYDGAVWTSEWLGHRLDSMPADAVVLMAVPDTPGYDEMLTDAAVADHPFIEYAEGVQCHSCNQRPAAHKVGEEINLPFHNLTAYLCCACFKRSVGDCSRWPYSLGKPAEALDV